MALVGGVGCVTGLALGVGLTKAVSSKQEVRPRIVRQESSSDDGELKERSKNHANFSGGGGGGTMVPSKSIYAQSFDRRRFAGGSGVQRTLHSLGHGSALEENSIPSPQPRNGQRSARRRDSALFTQVEHRVTEEKLVIVMVGLPARGKSYISKALLRYLNFLGCTTRLFNAGNLRRDEGKAGINADFFNPNNAAAKAQREAMAMQCLEQLLEFLSEKGNNVGILDATNTTIERRKKVREKVAEYPGMSCIFLESLCTDPSVLQENYRLKLVNDDYKGMDASEATADFENRVQKYEQAYQPLEDVEEGVEMSYIKLIDAGKKLVKHKCQTSARKSLPGHVFKLLHSIHLGARSIFIALVGESENSCLGRLGGDSPLTHIGSQRGPALAKFLNKHEAEELQAAEAAEKDKVEPTLVMCGTLQRHLHTVHHLQMSTPHKKKRTILKFQRLNELCVGGMDGLTLEEVEELYPEEARGMQENKLTYRYPGEGGESYQDLTFRLHENILRLEQLRGSAMVLCDPAVFRVFLAYFRATPLEQIPDLEVPAGIVQFTRTHSGFKEDHIDIPGGGA
eukprot:CAMPEP_0206475426 /NCGR_PEP_ID=MMETSP0324_2-20121206/34070_1 /ASSEMBLY_ACC=CAM_ASM_000836 /TAXON_ID=2866 /ORGANISM="Crypthecodinium cohnii, Strain Seligo" /LENGTH=567 /DNA_ID=CAMNT_0053950777 /DNA_START=64 /DNA_END=1767 /DNA_ORIENTATION=-